MEQDFPAFADSFEEYIEKISGFLEYRLTTHGQAYEDECQTIVKACWYTNLIPEIMRHSLVEQVNWNREEFNKIFNEFSGVWGRYVESLNLLRDSMILGLQGRTIAATSLLRPAFESIISGVFYHHLTQKEYRQSADYFRNIYKSAKGTHLLTVVEELAEEINHNRLAQELEFRLINQWLDTDSHIPTLKQMIEQIAQWKVLENEGQEIMNSLHRGIWDQLSAYSHSLLNRTYIGSSLQHTPMLELRANDNAIQDYTRLFRITCILVLLLLLASTEGLQNNPEFSKSMLKTLRDNPDMYDVLGSIPNQIEDVISNQ